MSNSHPDSIRTATLAGLSAYLIWGVSPLFFQLMTFATAAEIVMHRVLWGAPLLAGALWFAGKRKETWQVLADRKAVFTLILSAALISVNWWGFIHAVNNGYVLQASLGYYINPLLSVAIGVIVLREPLGPWRIAAIAFATAGVLNLIISVGSVPWLALLMALTFTGYGYLRKTVSVDGRVGLFWETTFILPFAIAGLVWLQLQGGATFDDGPRQAVLLFLGGAVTIIPLLLYIIGMRGLRLTTMGVLQFTAPSLQFIIGVMGGEAFTTAHAVTFVLIWLGVGTFIWSQLRRDRRESAAAGE